MMRALIVLVVFNVACNSSSSAGSACADAGGTCAQAFNECKLAPASAQDCTTSQETPGEGMCCAQTDGGDPEGGD